MFETRRPATPDELARLFDSWGIPSMNDQLAVAQISGIATLAELGAKHTVIAVNPALGADLVYTVAERHATWSAGGGHVERDQGPYQHFVRIATADLAFSPERSSRQRLRAQAGGFWMGATARPLCTLRAPRPGSPRWI